MPVTSDSADGDVFDFTGVFITRRTHEVEATDVSRLLLEDEGTQIQLLVPASVECRRYDFQTGVEYQISTARYCEPPSTATRTSEVCPKCDGRLRQGVSIDTHSTAVRSIVSSLGVDEPFALATDRTTVNPSDQDRRDDWIAMDARNRPSPSPPGYTCLDCGETFEERDLRVEEGVLHENVVHSEASMAAAPAEESLGLAAGGAKDITNFRENIRDGFTPKPGAISTEGLFYDYYFETGGASGDTEALFAPQYAAGISEHPVTGETQRHLAVGLDSTLSAADFQRPRLDLVAVLDVSGSMDSPFDEYYYDEQGRRREADSSSERKINAATAALCALTEQLRDEDRLGVVLYNNRAHVAKPLREVGATKMDAIRQHIRAVEAGGGTNMEDGFAAARDLLQDAPSDPETERRVVFMTDMMPNMGHTDDTRLQQLFEDAAADGVNTTFLGIGLDENADLADALSEVRGANHYFVHSVSEFQRRLGEEFEYMVSPLVYDLQLELDAEGCDVVAVHGAPGDDGPDERLIHVPTLFPSPKSDGETRGGVVLVELDGVDTANVELVASWVERDGSSHSARMAVDLPEAVPTFDHSGVRKAVALARYATVLDEWTSNVHARATHTSGVDDWIEPDAQDDQEAESVPLTVPTEYAHQFDTLRAYLAEEAEAVGDETLDQEVSLLETLCATADLKTDPATRVSEEDD